MRTIGKLLLALAIAGGAGSAGLWAGNQGLTLPELFGLARTAVVQVLSSDAEAMAVSSRPAGATPSGAVIYYRAPDGSLAYSAVPRQTPDGRAYLPVLASEDVSFATAAAPAMVTETATLADPAAPGEKRILYYRNPMGLPDTSPTPKNDSMGMAYIPVYDGEEADGSIVTVSAGKIQRSGVRTTLAALGRISQPILVPGVVVHDERKVSVISLRTEAFVEQVADVTTGAPITAGQPLVTIYAKEFAAAGAQYAADLRNGGKAAAAGSLQRLLNLGVPAEMIAGIEATGKAPISVTLLAPQSGVVLERMAVDGMMLAPGEPLFRIADTSTVWVIADVPEYELAAVQRGAVAVVRFRGLPGRDFTGKVDQIYPEIQPETRTAKLRIELPNPDGAMIAQMYGEVEIAAGGGAPVVTVPDSAVIDSGERQVVIVDLGDGRFEPRDVQVGLRGAGMVEIRRGIAIGDRVVVAANFLIDAESNLKAALSALVPPASGTKAQP